jgi:hemerythrin superfamily protein
MGIMAKMTGKLELYGILEAEHREVDLLMTELESSDDPEEQRRLFEEIREKLDAHAKAEQETLYMALAGYDPTHELVLEAFEEHRIVTRLLGEISRLSDTSDRFLAKCKVLHELVRHHVREEEREMFPKGRRELSGEEHHQIAKDYLAAKKRHMGKKAPKRTRETEHRAK